MTDVQISRSKARFGIGQVERPHSAKRFVEAEPVVEQWIDASLSSLVAEGAEGIEVILIDSSPTSATRDIARRYSDRLLMRIFERCDLSSWQAKTNIGVELARSSHVCWLGVDDLWLPGRAAAAQTWIDAGPDAPLHLAPSAIIDKDGRKLGVWRCPLPADRERDGPGGGRASA